MVNVGTLQENIDGTMQSMNSIIKVLGEDNNRAWRRVEQLREALEFVERDTSGYCHGCGVLHSHTDSCLVGQALKGWGE